MKPRTGLAALAAMLLVAGCAALFPVEAPVAPPPEFPEAWYQNALKQGKPVYRIDPAESLIVIEVHRGGSLARLGHDHVVASHDVTGYVAPGERRADLYVVLARMQIDEPQLREEAGFDTLPVDFDVEGTRGNMLARVLEADKFPFALITVTSSDARQKKTTLWVAITLHGRTRSFTVPADVESDDQAIAVSGKLGFSQTDFGITPYALLGGAIAVKDELELRFRIRARRM